MRLDYLLACRRFTAWLGQNSSFGKQKRLLGELHTRMSASGTCSADRTALRTDYLPTLRRTLVKPLRDSEKEGIPPVVAAMQVSPSSGWLPSLPRRQPLRMACCLGILLCIQVVSRYEVVDDVKPCAGLLLEQGRLHLHPGRHPLQEQGGLEQGRVQGRAHGRQDRLHQVLSLRTAESKDPMLTGDKPRIFKLPRSPTSIQACLWSNPKLEKLPRSPSSTQACLWSTADHCGTFCTPEEPGTTEALVRVVLFLSGSSTRRLLASGQRATS